MGCKHPVEVIQNHAGANPDRLPIGIELPDADQVLAGIHDQAIPDGLTGLGGAGAARSN